MSYLFEIVGESVRPDGLVLQAHPFKGIWDRDMSNGKEVALFELAYIEFMTSKMRSNPFGGYDEGIRHDVIVGNLGRGRDWVSSWVADELVKEGMELVRDIQTNGSPAYSFYMAARDSAEKLKRSLSDIDLNERTNGGAAVYKPKDITSALIDVGKVLENLSSLEGKVNEEMYNVTKVRAGKSISPFADPKSLKR